VKPYIDFWDSLDDLLMTIHRDTEAYVMGPEKLGRWCCNTCSATEISLMADKDKVSEPVYFFYHDQNRDTDAAECHLGWSGGQRALDLIKHYCDYYALVVDLPENEDTKILVKDN
jgi:hypothetical protein